MIFINFLQHSFNNNFYVLLKLLQKIFFHKCCMEIMSILYKLNQPFNYIQLFFKQAIILLHLSYIKNCQYLIMVFFFFIFFIFSSMRYEIFKYMFADVFLKNLNQINGHINNTLKLQVFAVIINQTLDIMKIQFHSYCLHLLVYNFFSAFLMILEKTFFYNLNIRLMLYFYNFMLLFY